jgi:hypothetical protein
MDYPENSPLHMRKTRLHQKNTNCGSISSSCMDWRNQSQKCILTAGLCSFKAWAAVVLYGHSFNTALFACVIKTFVSSASDLRDFLHEDWFNSSTSVIQYLFCEYTLFHVWFFIYQWPHRFQLIDQVVHILSTWNWFSWKLALKLSATFSNRLIFEIELHQTHTLQ